jgi:hypothetical protein
MCAIAMVWPALSSGELQSVLKIVLYQRFGTFAGHELSTLVRTAGCFFAHAASNCSSEALAVVAAAVRWLLLWC